MLLQTAIKNIPSNIKEDINRDFLGSVFLTLHIPVGVLIFLKNNGDIRAPATMVNCQVPATSHEAPYVDAKLKGV